VVPAYALSPRAHDKNGVRFLFLLVGVPDQILVTVPVDFERSAR
jgi:hypothetical protein